jgi:hypothetical protein
VVGDVRAESGSTLYLNNDKVSGSVIGAGALGVQTLESTVNGTIAITGAGDAPGGTSDVVVGFNTVGRGISVTSSAGTIIVDGNRVKSGDMFVTDNYIPGFTDFPNGLYVRSNTVTGNVTVSRNTGSSPDATKEVSSNTVTKTLRCENNDLPFTGGPNNAGVAFGQCFSGTSTSTSTTTSTSTSTTTTTSGISPVLGRTSRETLLGTRNRQFGSGSCLAAVTSRFLNRCA